MGVGGLLMEIVTRPQPREEPRREPRRRVAARRACRRPFEPHGRAEQAARRNRRQATGAHRRRRGARLAGAAGHRRHRPSARAVEAALAGLPVRLRAQSGFCRWPRHLAQGRHRGGAGGGRRRHRLPRRHAAGRCRADRPAHCRASIRRKARWSWCRPSRQARQSGAVVAALLSRPHGGRRRCRRAPSHRRATPRRWSRCRSAARRRSPTSTRRKRFGRSRPSWKDVGGPQLFRRHSGLPRSGKSEIMHRPVTTHSNPPTAIMDWAPRFRAAPDDEALIHQLETLAG